MRAGDSALFGVKVYALSICPDNLGIYAPGVLIRDEFECNLLLILFCQPSIGSEGNLYAAGRILARDGAHPIVTNRE
jgi:hypothetical protein